MGESNPQRALFYQLSLEKFVPEDHPLRRIRPLIDDAAIRRTSQTGPRPALWSVESSLPE